ncbi:cytochrome c biogenesis CcdA family protein [Terrilactibacillus laevilacticus]|uniref:Cytochrome c biogenesis CcdA family protein n=1 Tax=Terrilactibacillus laevilacticus TaxID=1380157 RepID=A0ABW5PUD7_9BACI|nr:cytochrome c biogenesis protein CcdA [Terrilactibacillus laevilacticus]
MDLNVILAFGAGMLSFLSPCTLPLYPGFISYLTGVTLQEQVTKHISSNFRKQALLHMVLFMLGFAFVFVALGMSGTYLSHYLFSIRDILRKIGALVLILLGLFLIEIIRPSFLMRERRVTFNIRPAGYLGSILIGMTFAAAWTPCTGPILAAILILGYSNPDQFLLYMIYYVIGFSLPFFLLSFWIGKISIVNRLSQVLRTVSGYFIFMMGIFLYFDWIRKLSIYLISHVFHGFRGF